MQKSIIQIYKNNENICEDCGYDCSEYPEADIGVRASLSQLMRSIKLSIIRGR